MGQHASGKTGRKPSWETEVLGTVLSITDSWCDQGCSRARAGLHTPISGSRVLVCLRHPLNPQLEAPSHIPYMGKDSELTGRRHANIQPATVQATQGRQKQCHGRSHVCTDMAGLAQEKGSALPEVSALLWLP